MRMWFGTIGLTVALVGASAAVVAVARCCCAERRNDRFACDLEAVIASGARHVDPIDLSIRSSAQWDRVPGRVLVDIGTGEQARQGEWIGDRARRSSPRWRLACGDVEPRDGRHGRAMRALSPARLRQRARESMARQRLGGRRVRLSQPEHVRSDVEGAPAVSRGERRSPGRDRHRSCCSPHGGSRRRRQLRGQGSVGRRTGRAVRLRHRRQVRPRPEPQRGSGRRAPISADGFAHAVPAIEPDALAART